MKVMVEADPGVAEQRLEELSRRVYERVGGYIYGEGDVSMEEVVGQLFTERGLKLAIAESCHRRADRSSPDQYHRQL